MTLYLIRHPKVDLQPGICYGHSDVQLTENWELEANEIIRKLGQLNNNLVFSSPLKRCRLLAEKISKHFILDDRLKELNFGAWEMMSWNDIKGKQAEKWMKDFIHVHCPGGESYIDLLMRIQDFFKELENYKHTTITIITHGGVIRTILALVQNIPLQKSFEIEVDYGQVLRLHFTKDSISQILNFADIPLN